MTDESWGASVADMRRGGRDAAFLLGAGLLLWTCWVPATLAGRLAGDVGPLIRDFGLEYLTTAFFVALMAALWRGRADLLPWIVAAGAAVLAQRLLGGTWYILIGALTGSLLGVYLDLRDAAGGRQHG